MGDDTAMSVPLTCGSSARTPGLSPRGRGEKGRRVIERYLDWEQRLYQFIEGRRLRPFAWGQHDCALFAADAVQQMTGVDLAADYRGKYRTLKEARGLGELADLVDRAGLSRKPNPRFAMRGDVVLMGGPRPALGICLGQVFVAPGREQLAFESMCLPEICWRVG